MGYQFTFDLNRCTGCQACVVGCWMENRAEQALNWRQVHTFNGFRHPELPVFHLSLACHHCEDPACLRNCPANAYTKDPTTGAVIIHAERCMGCRYCTWACPHDAPKFNPAAGTIEKCTLCSDRIQRGEEPACVARCPVEALGFEAATQEERHHELPGFPASAMRPSIRFVPLRRNSGPELGDAPRSALLARFLDQVLALPAKKVTLRGEWTLVVFTTVMSVLSAWFFAALIGGPALSPWVFLGLGLPAMLLSAWHLGRRKRAWRALLNLRTSWLSREIALTSAFLGLGGLFLIVLPQQRALGWSAALTGIAELLAIDRIYRVALGGGRFSLHSGQTLLNGLFLLGLLGGLPVLAIGSAALKIALYSHRKYSFSRTGRPIRTLLSATRLCLGLFAPLLLMRWYPMLAAIFAVLGDLVDRCEFYDELIIDNPELALMAAVRTRLNPFASD